MIIVIRISRLKFLNSIYELFRDLKENMGKLLNRQGIYIEKQKVFENN